MHFFNHEQLTTIMLCHPASKYYTGRHLAHLPRVGMEGWEHISILSAIRHWSPFSTSIPCLDGGMGTSHISILSTIRHWSPFSTSTPCLDGGLGTSHISILSAICHRSPFSTSTPFLDGGLGTSPHSRNELLNTAQTP